MPNSHRLFLRLLKDWPVNPNRSGGRDLGEYLNAHIKKLYKQGAAPVDDTHCVSVAESLQRILSDQHKKRYPRSLTGTAADLTVEDRNRLLSNDYRRGAREALTKGYFQTLKEFFTYYYMRWRGIQPKEK